jgi:hypothetical protein
VVATLYECQITARIVDYWKIDDFAVINAQRASPSATKLTALQGYREPVYLWLQTHQQQNVCLPDCTRVAAHRDVGLNKPPSCADNTESAGNQPEPKSLE